ncbi:MAG: hypothetical protein ACRDSK_28315 [Actinophytocola sp.]|uniref:hypothetical protein n=1 Tax=Actinophytocola sp. TaxID=1872138 RepID=UPI003D6A2EE3
MFRRGMFRRGAVAAALALGAVAVGAAPAQAIELPPPGTENLIVMNFYRGDDLVGQKWWGCPGQPAGRWGTETPNPTFHFVPC